MPGFIGTGHGYAKNLLTGESSVKDTVNLGKTAINFHNPFKKLPGSGKMADYLKSQSKDIFKVGVDAYKGDYSKGATRLASTLLPSKGLRQYALKVGKDYIPNFGMEGMTYEEGGFKRPTGKANVIEMQQLLYDEGYNLGTTGPKGHGVDGDWGKLSTKAFDKYTARANKRGITGHVIDPILEVSRVKDRIGPVKAPQAAQSYLQYLANAALQHYGFVGQDESFFDVDENDLRSDELDTYKSILRDNLTKGKKGKADYRDYSDDPAIRNARSSDAALQLIKKKGIVNILKKDALPFGGESATKEALHAVTGNASYTYDKKTGNVYLQDNYDFNKSQKNIKKSGASLTEIYNQITKGKYTDLWSNAHSAGDHIKTRVPVNINLGSATSLGLSPQEMRSLRAYNPSASEVKKVNAFDMFKNIATSIFD